MRNVCFLVDLAKVLQVMFWTSCYKQSSVQGLIPYYKKCPEVIRLLVPSLSLWNIILHSHPEAAEGLWLVTWSTLYSGDGELSSKERKSRARDCQFLGVIPRLSQACPVISAAEKTVQTRCPQAAAVVLCPAFAGCLVWLRLRNLVAQVFSACLLWFWSHPGPALSVLNWMSNRALHVLNKPPTWALSTNVISKAKLWPNPHK